MNPQAFGLGALLCQPRKSGQTIRKTWSLCHASQKPKTFVSKNLNIGFFTRIPSSPAHHKNTDDHLDHACLRYPHYAKKSIKLMRINSTYQNVKFSFTDQEVWVTRFQTLEEQEPALISPAQREEDPREGEQGEAGLPPTKPPGFMCGMRTSLSVAAHAQSSLCLQSAKDALKRWWLRMPYKK